jgi:two-component system chemotaxis sensor kinase CheA
VEGAAAETPPAVNSLAQDPELVADFVMESRQHLTSIEQRILTLDREPANADAIHLVFRGFHTIKALAGFLEFTAILEVAHEVETAPNLAREGKLAITPAESGPEAAPEPAARTPGDAKRTAAVSSAVRVDTGELDYLVDMVGEMVIAQLLVRHNETLAGASDPRLHRDLAQLARITGKVQRTAMAKRMVPIGQLFQRAARQVRDLSRKVGKAVELVTRGEETELDKTIADELADPLMHMVHNLLDHGIEAPEARAAAGKPAQVKVTLAAYHQGGQIVIEAAADAAIRPQKRQKFTSPGFTGNVA